MLGFFKKRKATKSKMQLANQFQDIAGVVSDNETRTRMLQMRDKILRQSYFPSNWKVLDYEISTLLYQISNQVTSLNTSTIDVYVEHIDTLVNARARREEYIDNNADKNLLGLKVQMHEMIDDVKRIITENAAILKKIERTNAGDPSLYALESNKKACEARYYDMSIKIKHLASAITEIVTRLNSGDIGFYEKLRGLQGIPEELEEQTATYLFHQQKFEFTDDENQRIINSRYAGAEPIPIPTPTQEYKHSVPTRISANSVGGKQQIKT